MKNILFFNTANSGGGAEKVAYTLCKSLHLRGYNSRMFARRIDPSADSLVNELVMPVPGSDLMYSAGNFLDEIFSTHYLFYLPTWKIPFMEITAKADVINLHNMHGYYFNLLAIPFLMWQKPVVWTLHDMWSFTGKCSWSFDCDRFANACGKCPELSKYPAMRHDRSRFHLRLKKFLYGRKNFVIVTPSAWLESQVHRSFMKDIPTHVIHSPIDTRLFYPEDKKAARERLGIPHDKKVVLFIASWVNTIPHKGVGTFKEMLSHLCETHSDIYPIIVGHLQGQSVLGDRFPGKETGWVNDVETMRACYASSDIFISPTLAENSSCTIMEALACGTPTVAYRTGGIPEQIVHGETGILVPPGDHRALLESITSLLNDSGMRLHFSNASVQRAKSHFALDVCLDKYLKVYDTAIRMK